MKKSDKNFNKLYKSGNDDKFSEEELIRDWTLSVQDKQMLAKFRKNVTYRNNLEGLFRGNLDETKPM